MICLQMQAHRAKVDARETGRESRQKGLSMSELVAHHPGKQPIPRNAWYVAAFSHEVTQRPMSRRLLGDRVVLYRTEDGRVVALADYCAHRAMPLSGGKVKGDCIQCPYHGLEYDPAGRCINIPSQPQIPSRMRVRSYPTVERWKWIWAWFGEPEKADPALIPDHSEFGLDNADYWAVGRFVMGMGGSYQLLHENLLDVSHITFLHAGSFDSGAIASAQPRTSVDGRLISISREVTEVVTGDYGRMFGLEDGIRVQRTLQSRTWVPCLNVITNTWKFPDQPDRPAAVRQSPFAITPETATSCHYFVCTASNYGKLATGEALEAQNKALWDVFLDDKQAVEAIQQAYDELGSGAPDCSVRADEAALKFRRLLNSMIAEEAAHSSDQDPSRPGAHLQHSA
jgi:phenylpropionate dioxygenase-like ring-hydroxylating dioxygenase large terminal subunit